MTLKMALRLIIIGLVLSIFATIFVANSMAQTLCAPLPDLLSGLQKRFGEVMVWEGRNKTHRTIVTANGGGRWSIIQVAVAGGPACMVAAGDQNAMDAGI